MTTVGIDFGNLYSSVAILQNERSEVVADSAGHRQLPSVITYNESKPFIGVEGQKIMSRFPRSTIIDLKMILGVSTEEAQSMKSSRKWDFHLSNSANYILPLSDGKEVTMQPLAVLQLLLSQLKKTSEDASGEATSKASKVVIAIPHFARPELKKILLEASQKIGWNDTTFISDHAAVVLAYELDNPDDTCFGRKVVVIDFGSNFRVSLVEILRGVILVKESLTFDDVNSKVIETNLLKLFAEEFKRKTKLDLYENKRAVSRLALECERVKGVLSQVQQGSVHVEGLLDGIDFTSSLTRAKFEMVNSSLFTSFTNHLKEAITAFNVDPDIIILSGGNCKIPKITQIIQNIFPDTKVLNQIDPNEVHAKGAALQAKYLQSRSPMVHGKKKVKSVKVIQKSISIETNDGALMPIILQNTPVPLMISLPCKCEAESLCLRIYEGDSLVPSENKKIAQLKIPDLPAQALTKGELTLALHVSEDGVLTIQASQQSILASLNIGIS
jgi:heat shock protein 1/8